jgi:putative nucleotidyltransferase with HDIG domain
MKDAWCQSLGTERKSRSLYSYHELIAAFVAAMEARDRCTASHSKRVSDMSEQICRILGLDEEETIMIHIAADLHDIGKIGISDRVLMGTGLLSDEERYQIMHHPLIGYEILRKVSSFQDVALIVRHHHERWDGYGYPDNIWGEFIPLGSRIIAIADSIDAMMSDRAYRNKLSAEKCRQEIIKNMGSMYDPDIAKAVLNNWFLILSARIGLL